MCGALDGKACASVTSACPSVRGFAFGQKVPHVPVASMMVFAGIGCSFLEMLMHTGQRNQRTKTSGAVVAIRWWAH